MPSFPLHLIPPPLPPCPLPRFWLYGDDDPTKRLELLDRYLSEFSARPVNSAVGTQALVPTPRKVVQHYAAGDAEEGEVPKVCVWVGGGDQLGRGGEGEQTRGRCLRCGGGGEQEGAQRRPNRYSCFSI